VLLQPRFRDRTAAVHSMGWPLHLTIFWGCVVYAGSFGLTLLKGLFPFLPYPWPDSIPILALALDVFGVLVLLALVIAAVRRFVLRPAGVKQTRDAAIILVLISLVLLTSLLGGSAELLATGHASSPWRPAGSSLLPLLSSTFGMTQAGGHDLYLAMWWSHLMIVLGFLSYLPYSKHFHLLVSPFGVYFTNLNPKGRMPAAVEEAEDAAFDFSGFTWRELLTPLACAECGRCDRACPAYNSGEPLSPQDLVHGLKEHLLEAGAVLARSNGGAHPTLEGKIKPEQIWACTTCYSCMEHCPVRNEHLPIIFRLRRKAVSAGEVDKRIQETLVAFQRYGNSYGMSERARAKWTQGLDFKIKDARKEPVRFLWFVGDVASYDARVTGSTRAVASLLHSAGADFGIMYEGERNSGNDVRRIGEEGLYEMLAGKNIDVLSRCEFDEIITTDPHAYNSLKNEYEALGASFKVRHYTELLLDLMRKGLLKAAPLGLRATYHDPCYLGRYNGVYSAPRELLRAIGVELVEMPRNGKDAYCCGAGGGRLWMEDSPGVKERPSESRVREAAALDGVGTMITACPKDVLMFQDALKTTGLENSLAIRDIGDLVLEATNKYKTAIQEN